MTPAEIFTAFQNVATGLAALGTVTVAYTGLSTWRRQLAGEASYELARRILRNSYIYRDTTLEAKYAWVFAFRNIFLQAFCSRSSLPDALDLTEKLALLKKLEAELLKPLTFKLMSQYFRFKQESAHKYRGIEDVNLDELDNVFNWYVQCTGVLFSALT